MNLNGTCYSSKYRNMLKSICKIYHRCFTFSQNLESLSIGNSPYNWPSLCQQQSQQQLQTMHCFDIVLIVLVIPPEPCKTIRHALVGPVLRNRGVQSRWNCWPSPHPGAALEACSPPGAGSTLVPCAPQNLVLTRVLRLPLVMVPLLLPPPVKVPNSPDDSHTSKGGVCELGNLTPGLPFLLPLLPSPGTHAGCSLAPREKPRPVTSVVPSLHHAFGKHRTPGGVIHFDTMTQCVFFMVIK